jgi:hypothetical protein
MLALSHPSSRTPAVVALVLVCAGCGGNRLNRQAVSGTVTYKGKPIVLGSIIFAPAEGRGPTFVSAPIQDGKFSIRKDAGPVPGTYQVRFEALDRIEYGPPIPGDPPPPPKKLNQEPLPAKYGAASKETAEVKAGASNVFTFALQ